jgi:hypothetical protein
MKRKLTVLLALIALLACVATATATAGGLRVIGSGKSSGQFAATAATGSKKRAHAVYVRGYGRGLSGHASVACSRGFSIGSKSKSWDVMRSGRLYRVPLPFVGDCQVVAGLGGSGRIHLQILAA